MNNNKNEKKHIQILLENVIMTGGTDLMKTTFLELTEHYKYHNIKTPEYFKSIKYLINKMCEE